MTTYVDAGVNVDLGDDVSEMLYIAARETWKNRKGKVGEILSDDDNFFGGRFIDVSNLYSGTRMGFGYDGVGTKMELAERLGDHSTIAYDLFAMVCDDAVRVGAEPIAVGTILDVNSLSRVSGGEFFEKEVRQLAKGYIEAAEIAGVAIVNGEVAELGNRVGGYGDFNYNWGASVAWIARGERMISPKKIRVGDSLVGFRELGFRSNGLSLVRRILRDAYGKDWHEVEGGERILRAALHPSRIYTPAIVDMVGGYDGEPKAELHGVAHITGGGIPGKLAKLLKPSGLGALVMGQFEPTELMLTLQRLGDVEDEDAYATWNMGNGMIVATPEPRKVVSIAESHGIRARKIGEVVKEPGICIENMGIGRGMPFYKLSFPA